MFRSTLKALVLMSAAVLTPGLTSAAEPSLQFGQYGMEAPVYGSQLMTAEERVKHRDKMQSANTAAEREQLQQQHHEAMQKRALERGVTLPYEAPTREDRMSPRGGTGADRPGSGPDGRGMGLGTGRADETPTR